MPLLGSSSGSSEQSYRGNLDDFPNQFTLNPITNLEPGQSGIATTIISGINYQAIVTATNNALISINGGSYSTATLSSPRYIRNNQSLSVKFDTTATNASDFSKVYSTVITVGRVRVNWSVTTRAYDDAPNPINFVSATNLPIGIVTNSNTVVVSGLEPGFATLSSIISGIGSFSINGGPLVTTGNISNGDTVFIQQRTPNNYSLTNTTSLRIGSGIFNYSVSTRAANLVVNPFSFTSLINVPINTDQQSNTVTITGPDPGVNLPVSISSPGQVKINNSSYVSGTTNCISGDTITVGIPATALSTYGSTVTTNLTVSGFTTSFSVTVRPAPIKTIPNQFDFTNKTNVEPLSLIESDELKLSGITTGDSGTASISGGNGEFRVRRNGTTVRDFSPLSAPVFNGDDITLRLVSAGKNRSTQTAFTVSGTDTTINLNGTPGQVSDIWSVISGISTCLLPLTLLQNTFTDVSNVEVKTEQIKTFVVSGISSSCDTIITISNKDFSYIIKNGVRSGESARIKPGDTISVVLISAPTYGTERRTTITSLNLFDLDSLSVDWKVTTAAEGITPNPLNVSSQNITRAEANTVYTIQAGTISGLTNTTRVNATITSTNGTARISKNSTASSNFFTTLSDIGNGDVIFISMRSNSNYGSVSEVATLNIGGLTEQWTISNSTEALPNVQLSISPNPIALNGSANITWASTNATSVVSSNFGATTLNGSNTINNITQQTEYNITVSNQRGQATGRATVFINSTTTPTVTLTASKTTVFQNETFTVTWNSTNATRVVFSTNFTANSVSGSTVAGPFTLVPGVSSTVVSLFITVENSVGQTATASVNITVLNRLPTLNITPSGAITIPFNGSFNLSWSTTDATEMSATFPIGQTEFNGNRTFSNITSSGEYIIYARNPSGETLRRLVVNVSTPPPTVSLTANPTNVNYNQNSTLSWTLNGATSYTSNFGASANNGNNGTFTVVGITSTKTYTLTASNSAGSASSSVTITVPNCSVNSNDDDQRLTQCRLKSGFITFSNGNTSSASYYISSLIPDQRFTSSYLNTTGIGNQLVVRRAFSFGVLHRIIYNAFINTLNLPPTNAQIQYYTDLFLRNGNSYILPEDLVAFINQNNSLISQQNAANGGIRTFNDFCLNPWFTTAPIPTIPSCTVDGIEYSGDFILRDDATNCQYTPGYVIFNNKTDNAINDLGGSENYYRGTLFPTLTIPNRSNFTYGQVHTVIRDTYIQELKTLPTINNINVYTTVFNSNGYATLQAMQNAIISNVASTKATWVTYGNAKGIVNVCGTTFYNSSN